MDKQEMEKLVELTNKLDAEGHVEEASALDSVLIRLAEAEEHALSGKATKALGSLLRSLLSFNGKNLDARGPKRRVLNKIQDMTEDLVQEIKNFGIAGEGTE